jgi:hypothetical protein
MCEVSGNRGILILIRQLPTGPSCLEQAPRAQQQAPRGGTLTVTPYRRRRRGLAGARRRPARGRPGASKILSKMQNLTKISVSAERNALASGSSLSSEGESLISHGGATG